MFQASKNDLQNQKVAPDEVKIDENDTQVK